MLLKNRPLQGVPRGHFRFAKVSGVLDHCVFSGLLPALIYCLCVTTTAAAHSSDNNSNTQDDVYGAVVMIKSL